MKTKRLFQWILTIGLSFILLPCNAQRTLHELQTWMPAISIPFYDVNTYYPQQYTSGVSDPDHLIPDHMYKNAQLTDYYHYYYPKDDDMTLAVYARFSVPSVSNSLIAVEFGGVTPYGTMVLCSVNPQGELTDALDVDITSDGINTRQFRIESDSQIILTTIYPSSNENLTFSAIHESRGYYGYRRDDYYSVNNSGHFQSTRSVTFEPRWYSVEYLSSGKNFWEGNEVPISE